MRLTQAAWQVRGLRATQKIVLLYLARCADGNIARASSTEIRRYTGMNKKPVPVALRVLEERGLISIDRPPGKKPEFTLHLPVPC